MTLLSDLGSFALVAGLVTIISGLDTAIVLRTAARDGRRAGYAAALGVSGGVLVWGVAAAVGISALLAVSSAGYTVLRIAGMLYMLFLGLRLLRQALRRDSEGSVSPPATAAVALTAAGADATAAGGATSGRSATARGFRRGFTTNLLNPKVGAFYVAVLPQFIPAHTSHLAVGLLLASVHDLEGLVWFSLIIAGAHAARRLLEGARARRAIDGVTGLALVGFGLRLGLKSR